MYKENTTPLVSIIIPCYNYGQYIEKCIQSALDQTYDRIEVIVVDNGSIDNSLEKINLFSNNKKVKIIELKENIPPGTEGKSAVGIAIKNSSGGYISILYADDWYLKSKIKKQIDLFNKLPSSVGVVYCHGYRYIESVGELTRWKMQSVSGYIFKDYLKKGDVVIPISPLVKRYCYEIIGLDNMYTGSEYDFLVMSQYVDFNFVDDYLVVMRDHENNDAKNVHSVYKRVQDFHTKVLLSDNAKSRGGRLVNKRVSRDYLSFGLKFITMLDMDNAKKSIIESIKIYPLYLLNLKVLISLILIFIPISMSEYILIKFNKISIGHKNDCNW
jgi:alpha-1,3-rhamnosyltransferase